MVGRMTRLNCNEGTPTCRARLTCCREHTFYHRPIRGKFQDPRRQLHGLISRGRPEQLDRIVRGHRAERLSELLHLHQMPRGSPIAMAIKQRPNNPAIQHAREGLMVSLWLPPRHHHFPSNETADPQTPKVSRATPETLTVRGIFFLEAELVHGAQFCANCVEGNIILSTDHASSLLQCLSVNLN